MSPCALSPPGPIPGPDNNTAASRHRGLALTINAMNKSHKRVGNALYRVRQSPVLPFKDSFYVGIRLLLMKFKLIRGNQKPPIRLQIDFFWSFVMSQHRAAGFTGSQLPRWVGRKGGPAPNLSGSIPYPGPGEKMGDG